MGSLNSPLSPQQSPSYGPAGQSCHQDPPVKMSSTISTLLILSATYTLTAASWLLPQQEETQEEGEARVGFIQLNSGSTSFNTTLNLTGPILLGLGIAAATLFYAYFNAFNGRKKRSVTELGLEPDADLLTVLDAVELSTTLEDFLESVGLTTTQCKMKAVCEMYQNRDQVGKVDRKPENQEAGRLRTDWVEAAEIGLSGEKCYQRYSQCKDSDFKQNLLDLSF